MEKIAIVTDSLSDIPEDLIKTYGIFVVPLTINIEGVAYKDGVDLTKEVFYKLLKEGKLPTTSQVSPVEFIDVFNDLLKSYDYIIAIILSSKLSGTYQSAVIAKDMVDAKRVEVIDSRHYSLGNGFLVLQAAKMAVAGFSKEEIVQKIYDLIPKIRYIMAFDSLDYLYRGGRLPKTQAFLGNILSIKPILMNEDGELKIVDKVRGQKKVIRWIIDYMKNTGVDFKEREVGLIHTDQQEFLNEIEIALRNELGITNFIRSRASCGIGTHAGPAAVGVFFEEK
ncbi:DegV domain-containing protein [Thermoanaerobacter kivui]|uniref:DegV domain-containing protein n=1 Tax=Thermoanaerobacter kivui TaxID=2325 RepID=A0A097ARX6_THEKI|nr:DegV family protein [Thermoanaerobacter kivui]AIS52576.1 DegV domain-containing protein [Thermoanaerobacter kivui]